MHIVNRWAFVAALTLLACTTNNAGSRADHIAVVERPDAHELTVPVSRLIMSIPKEGFAQKAVERTGATASRRYFQLEDATRHLIVSGWFEAQEEFPGVAKVWEADTSAWSRNNLPKPDGVSFKRLGGWDGVAYQMPRASGSNAHIRAHWLQAGTWIDLHLSVDSELSQSENMAQLESLLARIRVSEK